MKPVKSKTMDDILEDLELVEIIKSRAGDEVIEVDINDL